MDIVELNEAFSAQSLAVLHDLPIAAEKLNIDGGAIALGHPLGATGARITGKAASLLQREDKQYALATQCIGGGEVRALQRYWRQCHDYRKSSSYRQIRSSF
jgi:acetyl-CoA acyltransferase